MSTSFSEFWNATADTSGHTGYVDKSVYRYDQPVRLKTMRRLIGQLFPGGLAGKTVLDIGCGTGDFVALSIELGAAAVDGVDVSSHVLAKAAARFSNEPRVVLECGPVYERVRREQRYDLITSVTVLQHHVDEQELVDVLKVLHGALKPGGRMVVLELAPPGHGIDQQYSRGMLYVVERSPAVWRSAFSAAGFTVLAEPAFR